MVEPSSRKLFGPHALPIKDGSPLDAYIDPGTREAKFIAAIEAGLLDQLGHPPTFSEQLLVRRISRAALRLELFDKKMEGGRWTDRDARTLSALQNGFRLFLRELRIKAATPEPRSSSLASIAARHREKAASDA
jgi:hypothetical protein